MNLQIASPMTHATSTQSSPSLLQLRDYNVGSFHQNHKNVIIHSKVNFFDRHENDSGLSIKLTLQGVENYRIDGRVFRVREGQYLVVNKGQQFDCFMESRDITEGICIYLDPKLVEDIYRVRSQSDESLLNLPFFDDHQRLTFFENIYALKGNALGELLHQITPRVRQGDTDFANEDFYYLIAEKLLETQASVLGDMDKIQSEKISTRQELYRRLLNARNFIDGSFQEKITIADIADCAALSEYHLHRTFRQCFGITPHQYIIQKRLDNASSMLRRGQSSVGEIAVLNGFSDIHAFSKAFKKAFGVPPTQFRN
jgi:AraC-like DNA-binding protein